MVVIQGAFWEEDSNWVIYWYDDVSRSIIHMELWA